MTHPIAQMRRRGSAMVEFSISLLFLVPVLLYSSYLSDAIFARLKIQEATAAATWDYTGRLLHDYNNFNHAGLYSGATSSVQSKTMTAYQGLDPWAAANGGSPSEFVGMGAKSKLISVTCAPASGVADPSTTADTLTFGQADLHTGGLIRCQAQGQVTNWLMGHATPQSNLLNVTIWPKNLLGSISLCGVGAPSGGSCGSTNGLTVFTDDWGLAQGGDETNNVAGTQNNARFYNVTKKVYESNPLVLVARVADLATFYKIYIDPMPAFAPHLGEHELAYEDHPHQHPITYDNSSGSSSSASSPAGDFTTSNTAAWDGTTTASDQISNTWPFNNNDNPSGFGPSGYTVDRYKAAWNARVPNKYLGAATSL